ncbi:MAG: hypothetical protein ACM3WU_08065 [Bacillota bacterium]
MSDKEKAPRPASRRPSYLSGPAQAPKAPPPDAAPKREETKGAQEVTDKELVSWKVWLLPRRPRVSAFVVVALLGCIGVAYWQFPNFVFVAIITMILINRLGPYLFPVTYTLTEQTAGYKTVGARDVRPWSKIFTYYEFPDGVLLSHDTRGIRGRLREGLFMYYEAGAANKDQVLDVVKSKLKPPAEAMAPNPDAERDRGGIGSALRRVRKLKNKD